MSRTAVIALLLALALIVAGCGGDERTDPDTARLEATEQALQKSPRDPFAMADVIRAAAVGATHRVDAASGNYEPAARRFLDRAVAVWPRYLRATRNRPDSTVASLMVAVYGNGLKRPAEAARAAEFVALDRPSAASYLSLAQLSAQAGNRRKAERARVRASIRLLLGTMG